MAPNFQTLARDINRRPKWSASALIGIIFAFLLTLFMWAYVTEIEDITRVNGKVIPSENIHILQASEAGVVTKLYVKEGQQVRKGDLLIAMDPENIQAQLKEERAALQALKIRATRLTAKINDTPLIFPAPLAHANPHLIQNERALYNTYKSTLASLENRLKAQLRIHEEERNRSHEELKHTQQTHVLLNAELAIMRPLVERNLEPERTVLRLKRKIAENALELSRAKAGIAISTASITEIKEQHKTSKAERRAKMLQNAVKTENDIAKLEARHPAMEARLKRATLLSPIDGVINRIHLKTQGSVAQPSQNLVEIIPSQGDLLVEAYISPKDIGFLYPTQSVRVRLTAYDSTRYGALHGTITRIGADAIPSKDAQSSNYIAIVTLTGHVTGADGAPLRVIPGMRAEVDILARPKTVLDYIIRPITRVKNRAFRD
ncbi:MAG: HlyD family type I secretion periplasmic adaptor subunit [Halocynthiibacter sp.]